PAGGQAREALGGDEAPASGLRGLRGDLQGEAGNEPRLGEVDSMLDSAEIQLDEALALLQRIRDDLDLDPDALDAIERRLTRVQDPARKHRLPVAQLAAHRDALAAELESLADADARLQRLDGEIAAALAEWQAAARALGASRRKA